MRRDSSSRVERGGGFEGLVVDSVVEVVGGGLVVMGVVNLVVELDVVVLDVVELDVVVLDVVVLDVVEFVELETLSMIWLVVVVEVSCNQDTIVDSLRSSSSWLPPPAAAAVDTSSGSLS